MAVRIGAGALALLALIALRGKRWAYLAFIVVGLAYFPAQPHFHLHLPKPDLLLPTMPQLVLSLHNYAYIALFAGFYWMSWVQFRDANARLIWALLATLLVAALVELGAGMLPRGHARLRDLAPDVAGALGAALVLAIWARLTRKPAYVRLGKPRSAAAPRAAPAAPAPTLRRSVPPQPVTQRSGYAPPPPPPDFSPGPTIETTPAADTVPTPAAAPRRFAATRPAIMRRLRAVLGNLRPQLQRAWVTIRGRRRTAVLGGVLVVVASFGAFTLLHHPSSAPAVAAHPDTATAATAAPEPPPPPQARPLQSEAEGYYEPSYQFTVSDRRFSRLTLRPQAFVTFSRLGSREEVGCGDARIGPATVHLRCEFERVGTVTIEGQFTARSVTSRLDAPVLNAMITVSNLRGETVFSGRESFYWHSPD